MKDEIYFNCRSMALCAEYAQISTNWDGPGASFFTHKHGLVDMGSYQIGYFYWTPIWLATLAEIRALGKMP